MTPGKMLELSWNGDVENGTYDQLMVNWWFGGLVVWDSKRVPVGNNPFHKGIAGVQTTTANHQWTISWYDIFQPKVCVS